MFPGRTTPTLIQLTCDIDPTVANGNLQQFINSANELVTEICAPFPYTFERLQLIETWLAAAFYRVWDRKAKSESVNGEGAGVAASYESSTTLMLFNSEEGQMAMLLDTYGGLSQMSVLMTKGMYRRRVGMKYVGGPPCYPSRGPQIFP